MVGVIGQGALLTEGELRAIRGIAKARFLANRGAGVTNSKYGPQSNEQTDTEGLCGEMAFCKIFNVMPDIEIGPRSARLGSDLGDAVIYPWGYSGGKVRVDVKTTNLEHGRLLVSLKKQYDRDMAFCLMIGSEGYYRFAGFMPNPLILQKNRLTEVAGHMTYVANQKDLMSLDELKEYYANE